MQLHRGKWITFEGGEGCGKTTQAKLLVAFLQDRGLQVLHTREPGGAVGSERIRALLVEKNDTAWLPETELLLMNAARVEHLQRVILPALAAGTFVVCDRFVDSSVAYQGFARGLGDSFVWNMHRLCCGDALPDLTFFLDIDPEAGLKRAFARAGESAAETRFEALGLDFHRAVYRGFCALAERFPQRITKISAEGNPEEVAGRLRLELSRRLGI